MNAAFVAYRGFSILAVPLGCDEFLRFVLASRGGAAMNDGDNPMSKAHAAPRCAATSKRTGERCKGPAVKGWRVCRFHGADGGHSPGKDHPSWRHGMRSREWIEARAEINELVREAREIEHMLCGGAF